MLNSLELDIYKKIKQAIIKQKLRPNMQLIEKDLAESFGVSRTPVRTVLRRLEYEKLVKIKEHKGTFVSCSTIEEAKEVFEMRKILEGEAVRRACRLFNEEQIQELETLVEEEQQISESPDFYESLKISGDFHLKIAEIAGNSYFYQYLEDLISLTYVIIAIYGRGEVETCGSHDHMQIFNAIKKRDGDLAERLSVNHLSEIESNLHFNEELQFSPSLTDIFQ
ncbi:GntR family transcriptional regulator [Peribacillus muralis]|uniref:GntR family transcriptional regulator n=1 Tax=Peribacillus muralis TaxID=264697 RepID=UPI00380039B8